MHINIIIVIVIIKAKLRRFDEVAGRSLHALSSSNLLLVKILIDFKVVSSDIVQMCERASQPGGAFVRVGTCLGATCPGGASSGGSGVYILGGSGVAIIAAGGTDLYCHSEPSITSGKLCFIINFIGGHREGPENLLGDRGPLSCPPPFEPPLGAFVRTPGQKNW